MTRREPGCRHHRRYREQSRRLSVVDLLETMSTGWLWQIHLKSERLWGASAGANAAAANQSQAVAADFAQRLLCEGSLGLLFGVE